MAVRSRGDETPARPERVKFTPIVGRDYVTLIHRETRRIEMVPVDEWARMRSADGTKVYATVKCSTCGGDVISRCVAVGLRGRPLWRESCPHLTGKPVEGEGDSGSST